MRSSRLLLWGVIALFAAGLICQHGFSEEYVAGNALLKFSESIGPFEIGYQNGHVVIGIGWFDSLSELFSIQSLTHVFVSPDPVLSRIYKIGFPDTIGVLTVVEAFQAEPEVDYAEPNARGEVYAIPNDSLFSFQWAHRRILSCKAWDVETGDRNIVIAILDSGIDTLHPDLRDNLWRDPNGYFGYDFAHGDSYPEDEHGHGTHCAGIAGAVTDNVSGVAGLAGGWFPVQSGCAIMTVKVYATGSPPVLWCAQGVEYAANNGADVLTMSWGFPGADSTLRYAIGYAYSEGCVLVAAAGNSGTSAVYYPAGWDSCIAVAATDSTDRAAPYTTFGTHVDVSACGGYGLPYDADDILSTMPTYEVWLNRVYGLPLNYAYLCGTSMSAPSVAGLAGLVLSQDSTLTNTQVRERILGTVDNINAFQQPWYRGLLGTGRVNAYKALTVVARPVLLYYSHSTVRGGVEGHAYNGTDTIAVTLQNVWEDAGSVCAILRVFDPFVVIVDSLGIFGSIAKYDTANNCNDPFVFRVDSACPIGHRFTLNLEITADSYVMSDSFPVEVGRPFSVGFPVFLGGYVCSSPTVEDLDGDGRNEVVVGSTNDTLYAIRHNGEIMWRYATSGDVNSSAAVADLDGDRKLEVVIGASTGLSQGNIYALTNTGLLKWVFPTVGRVDASPALGDLDGDGLLNVVVGTANIGPESGLVYALKQDGDTLWTYQSQEMIPYSPALGDLNLDGHTDVVFSASRWLHGGHVTALNGIDGSVLWKNATDGYSCSCPSLGDLDNEGNLEIVAGGEDVWGNGMLFVWNHDGTPFGYDWPISLPDPVESSPALMDPEEDDTLEIIVRTNWELCAINYEGMVLWSRVIPHDGAVRQSSPAVGDITGDGVCDIAVGSTFAPCTTLGWVGGYESDGDTIPCFPSYVSGWVRSSPALADLKGDGRVNIVVGSNDGYLYAWDCEERYDPFNIQWGMFRHDQWHTGNYHWEIGLYSSSPLATAYNGGRKLCREPNTDDLWLAYQTTERVYAAHSEDGGKSWMRSCLGSGGFLTIGVTAPAQGPAVPPYPVVVWTAPPPNVEGTLWCARLWEGKWQVDTLHGHPGEIPHLPSLVIDTYEPYRLAHLAWETVGVGGNMRYLNYGTFQPDSPNWPPTFYSVEHIDYGDGFDRFMSPSVDVDYLTGTGVPRPHIVYTKGDHIWYATPGVGGWWLELISQPDYISNFPFVQVWGDVIHAMWAGHDPSAGPSTDEVWYRYKHVYEIGWADWAKVSDSPADSSQFPVMAAAYPSWSEKWPTILLGNWEIMFRDQASDPPPPPVNISQTSVRSMFCHENYRQLDTEPRYLIFVWTEGDGPVYEVRALEYALAHPPVSYYYIRTGQEGPSFFCLERDSFIQFGPEPYRQVDIDSTQLLYRLPGLKPYLRYQLVVTAYWEGSGEIKQRLDIDGMAERLIKVEPGVPETLEIWIPPAAYADDRSVEVTMMLLQGDWTVAGPLILYEFERGEGKEVLAGGGSQSAEIQTLIPKVFSLSQNYPNPFNGTTTIRYQLPREVRLNLKLYNMCGQLIETVVDERQKPGYYAASWDGRDSAGKKVACGVYFCRLDAGDWSATKKLLLLR